MTTVHKVEPAWAENFDNSKRHCWWNTKDETWIQSGDNRTACATWREHPLLRGSVQWMRFIHAFGDQVDRETNPFIGGRSSDNPTDPRVLFVEVDGHPTSDGRHTYCETYLVGHDASFRVFLSNDDTDRWARIECYDAKLTMACRQAWAAVKQQSADEEAN